ncbi:MAG: hypothetical protein FD144_5937, partial [Rhodospirillaceae bacterium]
DSNADDTKPPTRPLPRLPQGDDAAIVIDADVDSDIGDTKPPTRPLPTMRQTAAAAAIVIDDDDDDSKPECAGMAPVGHYDDIYDADEGDVKNGGAMAGQFGGYYFVEFKYVAPIAPQQLDWEEKLGAHNSGECKYEQVAENSCMYDDLYTLLGYYEVDSEPHYPFGDDVVTIDDDDDDFAQVGDVDDLEPEADGGQVAQEADGGEQEDVADVQGDDNAGTQQEHDVGAQQQGEASMQEGDASVQQGDGAPLDNAIADDADFQQNAAIAAACASLPPRSPQGPNMWQQQLQGMDDYARAVQVAIAPNDAAENEAAVNILVQIRTPPRPPANFALMQPYVRPPGAFVPSHRTGAPLGQPFQLQNWNVAQPRNMAGFNPMLLPEEMQRHQQKHRMRLESIESDETDGVTGADLSGTQYCGQLRARPCEKKAMREFYDNLQGRHGDSANDAGSSSRAAGTSTAAAGPSSRLSRKRRGGVTASTDDVRKAIRF